jgi:apocytochrome f
LTKDPNIGGFGQTETEIVLQSPERIYGYMLLCFFLLLTQVFLVIKKKQFEKVQISEMNF